MIPYELDPSLHTGKPGPQVLDDGFSPPQHTQPPPASTAVEAASVPAEPADPVFAAKSAF